MDPLVDARRCSYYLRRINSIEGESKNLRAEKEKLRTKLEAALSRTAELEDKNKSFIIDIVRLRRDINELGRQKNSAVLLYGSLKNAFNSLETKISATESANDFLRTALKNQMNGVEVDLPSEGDASDAPRELDLG